MAERTLRLVGAQAEPIARPLISNAALGMLIFVLAEGMMFSGLMSAFAIVKAAAPGGWPPPGQARLPIEETAFNSLVLLASGGFLWLAARRFKERRSSASTPLLISGLMGLFFVGFQGVEWVSLVRQGLTLTSSTHGSFFYLIVGMHGVHALAGLAFLLSTWLRLRARRLDASVLAATQILWFFVVGLWPILYVMVYL